MISIRQTSFSFFVLLLAVPLLWPSPAEALDDELSGKHLESLVPEELAGYTLQEVDVQESSPTVRGSYKLESGLGSVTLALSYGEQGAQRYQKTRGKLSMAAAQGEVNIHELSVQGQRFVAADVGSQFIVMAYFNDFLVGVSVEAVERPGQDAEDPKSTAADFLEKVGVERFAEWSPPEDVEYTLAEVDTDVSDCFDVECFSEYVSSCERARLVGALGRRVTAQYTVEEQVADDQCRLSLVFTDNPNPEWEGTPLYFTVDPAEDFTMEEIKGVMENCVEGDGEAYNCEGPLLDRMKE